VSARSTRITLALQFVTVLLLAILILQLIGIASVLNAVHTDAKFSCTWGPGPYPTSGALTANFSDCP
jgi:hypothetical protein